MFRFSKSALGFLGFAGICLLGYSIGYGQSSDDSIVDDPPMASAAATGKAATGRSAPGSRLQADQPEYRMPLIRLPRYFSGIVDQQQRIVIQEIQRRYRNQIEALETELELLRGQQLREMETVLTDSQLKLLNQKREQTRMVRSLPRGDQDGEIDQAPMRESSTQ
jgi:hypothetical protein